MPARLRLLLVALVVAASAATGATALAGPRAAPAPITIAVVDTGVDVSHPDLAGKLVAGYDVATGNAPTSDAGWHGTAVASIAAGMPDSSLGITSYCSQCSVMPVKVLDAHGEASDGDIARGIRWAVDHGARVVNLSLEGPTEDPALPAAIHYASRHHVVVVAAAGNDGTSSRSYPAAEPLAIGVAATDPSDRLYPWSNRGRWVTVAAPGTNMSAVGHFGFSGPRPRPRSSRASPACASRWRRASRPRSFVVPSSPGPPRSRVPRSAASTRRARSRCAGATPALPRNAPGAG
jgi:subtilisin family serine protease